MDPTTDIDSQTRNLLKRNEEVVVIQFEARFTVVQLKKKYQIYWV